MLQVEQGSGQPVGIKVVTDSAGRELGGDISLQGVVRSQQHLAFLLLL